MEFTRSINTRLDVNFRMASIILNASLMEQRHKKAMEELENEMQIELEKSREQLNAELQKSLEKELENHKGEFLNQLATASKVPASGINDIGRTRGRQLNHFINYSFIVHLNMFSCS